jgi:hypothetical protein
MAHGQKKRRKRSLEGLIAVDGRNLHWKLLSEPQWTTEDGYRGLRISIQADNATGRQLVLEYPMPPKTTGNGMPQLPQRPKFSVKFVEDGVRQAIVAGWDAGSRGRDFVFKVEQSN